MLRAASLFAGAILLVSSPSAAQEVIAAIQVHGNTLTTSDVIVRASGIAIGDPVSDELLTAAEARLRAAMTFDSIAVLKRYASLSDPTQVLVLIQVDEGPVRIDVPDAIPGAPGAPAPPARRQAVRRSRFTVMFLPVLEGQDGYGLTYGAQFAVTGHRSMRRRIVVPATWGGDKRIGAEYQQEFSRRIAPQLRTGALLQRRTHPFFDDPADRRRVWARAEWPIVRIVRAAAEVAWQSSSIVGQTVEAKSISADVVIDTRIDPLMPHNAIFVRSSVERLYFSSARSPVKSEIDANAYLGLHRGIVLAVRAVREDFSTPAPSFYKSILGGTRNLRGFRAGHAIGDTLVAGSAEVRVPTTSPLRMARFGISVFADAGTTYDKGQRLRDRKFARGVGAGIWATAPLFRFSAAVARGLGSGARAHVSAGVTF